MNVATTAPKQNPQQVQQSHNMEKHFTRCILSSNYQALLRHNVPQMDNNWKSLGSIQLKTEIQVKQKLGVEHLTNP